MKPVSPPVGAAALGSSAELGSAESPLGFLLKAASKTKGVIGASRCRQSVERAEISGDLCTLVLLCSKTRAVPQFVRGVSQP